MKGRGDPEQRLCFPGQREPVIQALDVRLVVFCEGRDAPDQLPFFDTGWLVPDGKAVIAERQDPVLLSEGCRLTRSAEPREPSEHVRIV